MMLKNLRTYLKKHPKLCAFLSGLDLFHVILGTPNFFWDIVEETHKETYGDDDPDLRMARYWINAYEKLHEEERDKGNKKLFESEAYRNTMAWIEYWKSKGA